MNSMDCFNQKETLTWALDRPPAGWKQGWILNHLALFFLPPGDVFSTQFAEKQGHESR